MEYLSEPNMFDPDEMKVDLIDIGPSWMDPIQRYLTTGSLLTDKPDARRIRYRSAKYHIVNGILYKRGYTLPYLRCIYLTQVKGILQ